MWIVYKVQLFKRISYLLEIKMIPLFYFGFILYALSESNCYGNPTATSQSTDAKVNSYTSDLSLLSTIIELQKEVKIYTQTKSNIMKQITIKSHNCSNILSKYEKSLANIKFQFEKELKDYKNVIHNNSVLKTKIVHGKVVLTRTLEDTDSNLFINKLLVSSHNTLIVRRYLGYDKTCNRINSGNVKIHFGERSLFDATNNCDENCCNKYLKDFHDLNTYSKKLQEGISYLTIQLKESDKNCDQEIGIYKDFICGTASSLKKLRAEYRVEVKLNSQLRSEWAALSAKIKTAEDYLNLIKEYNKYIQTFYRNHKYNEDEKCYLDLQRKPIV